MDPNTRALVMGAAGSGDEKIYVEDVFSTFLYTGNGSTQTITNGIDLSGKGGLVWIKGRSVAYSNYLTDTVRGPNKNLFSDSTLAEQNDTNSITAFNSNGWSMDAESGINASSQTYASWTFRKAAKFFDVVTYTGNGTARTIGHNLGSVPGCIIIKRTNAGGNWFVYHRGLSNPALDFINLNTTSAASTNFSAYWNSTAPTSTVFSLGTEADINANGGTYVAYLFAHDAGGFGDTGNDNIISCGSYVGNGSTTGPTVAIGWEPQWLLIKNASTAGSFWSIFDNMRGMVANGNAADDARLMPHAASAESLVSAVSPSSTGFSLTTNSADYNELNSTYIYIAIRRGPMKTPTDATKVFSASTADTGNNTPGFVTDNLWTFYRGGGAGTEVRSRLQGNTPYLDTSSTAAEATGGNYKWDTNNGVNYSWGNPYIGYYFRRAPGFFDVVAYTGTGSARTVSHNLGVAPELMIVKRRESDFWMVYTAALGNTKALNLNNASAPTTLISAWNNTSPTSTVFTVGTATDVNASGGTYVAYLFATLTGISKVGSYTGTGTTQQINCGFTAGARFVLIKRTDSTGDWYVWDTARGIISGNDPYLLLNSTAAEVTSTDYIDPLNSGFEISSTAPAAINANGGSFIYLAIA